MKAVISTFYRKIYGEDLDEQTTISSLLYELNDLRKAIETEGYSIIQWTIPSADLNGESLRTLMEHKRQMCGRLFCLIKYCVSDEDFELTYGELFRQYKEFDQDFVLSLNDIQDYASYLIESAVEVISKKAEEKEVIHQRVLELKYYTHVCTCCDSRPAILIGLPCRHPSLCKKCYDQSRSLKAKQLNCYRCRSYQKGRMPMKYPPLRVPDP